MSSGQYPHLFAPLRIGPVTVANRIVFSAHLTNYAEDGHPSAQHAAYYAARARGGAGLIITEEHSVHPTDWPYEKLIHGYAPTVVPGYQRITEAVHRYGTPIFAQLNHNGGQGSGMYSRAPVWAPSAVFDPLFREVPHAVTAEEIGEIVAGYAITAGHCAAGGFDGVELQCSHSSIVRGFLSPATNRRTDRYGGDLANRARLLLEIVAAVREAIGPQRALGVRICGDELIEHGSGLADAVEVARMVAASGRVDYINTSIGVATATLYMIEAPMVVRPGYAMYIAAAIRRAVDLPVVGVGRIKDPVQAERALADGFCDLVGVVRGQIADAEFAAKARAGRTESIRLCLSCNQECVARMGLNRWLGCIENPLTGREATRGPACAARPDRPRDVLVVGAGPAGLQTAIAAAARGHLVTVVEQQDEPGGAVRLAASVPTRAEFGDLVRNQLHEVLAKGIALKTGVRVGVEEVLAHRPDVVVLATGARPARPWWVPPEADRVVDVRDVLTGTAAPAGRVVVIDETGFHQATSVAELLADRGCSVEIIGADLIVAQGLGPTLDFEHWCLRAGAKGIVQTPEHVATGLSDDGSSLTVQLLHHPSGNPVTRDADWVVLAVPDQPDDDLYRALTGHPGIEVHRVGDALAPRRAHAAVLDGDRVGSLL